MVGGHLEAVTGLILAGGQARRMSGEDKGLVGFAGRPMVEHVIEALRPQVGSLLLSANRNFERYAAYGHAVVADELDGYQGPLAGVLSAMRRVATEFTMVVPCDAPCLPPDLVRRLHASCLADAVDLAVVHDGRRLQPVFLLLRSGVGPDLASYVAKGGRSVEKWLGQARYVAVDFSDEPGAFANVNDLSERQQLESGLLSGRMRAG